MKFNGSAISLYVEIADAARECGINLNDVSEFDIADDLSGIVTITTAQKRRYTVQVAGMIHIAHVVEGSVVSDEKPRQLAAPKEQA